MSRFALCAALLAVLAAVSAPATALSDRHIRDVATPRPAKQSPSPRSDAAVAAAPLLGRPAPSGETSIHDPSGAVYDWASKQYYQFGTGLREHELLASHVSTDGYAWKRYTPVFDTPPTWVFTSVPNYRNMTSFWAPDILHMHGLWHLYYAVSSFGSQTSCIGLATNAALDSSSAEYEWVDHGAVLCSDPTAPYNCIDPHVSQLPDGTVYMNWGSYWEGIFVQQLTGHPVVNQTTGTQFNVAKNPVKDQVIEASWIQHHQYREERESVYYLFVNWGQCCAGVNSTYQIRYGNSSNITGPFLDADGVDLAVGGGTLLMGTHEDSTRDRQVGPGQVGFPTGPREGGGPNSNHSAPVISFHFYDRYGEPEGARSLGQAAFVWGDGVSGWPSVQERLPA